MYKKIYVLIALGLYLIQPHSLNAKEQLMVITASLTNLRASPHAAPKTLRGPALSGDIKGNGAGQLSQLLFGENIIAEPTPNAPGWLTVVALEQRLHDGTPLRGYIKETDASPVETFTEPHCVVTSTKAFIKFMLTSGVYKTIALPFGSKLPGKHVPSKKHWTVSFSKKLKGLIHEDHVTSLNMYKKTTVQQLRTSIALTAQSFIDTPYVWGGRSMVQSHMPYQLLGIDCSNLTNLVFSMHGITIPRNSKSQHNTARPVKNGSLLHPGDLIFFTSTKSDCISHVVMYLGNNMIINADGLATAENFSSAYDYAPSDRKKLCVRLLSLTDYIGASVNTLSNGMKVPHGIRKGATMYLGSFF